MSNLQNNEPNKKIENRNLSSSDKVSIDNFLLDQKLCDNHLLCVQSTISTPV